VAEIDEALRRPVVQRLLRLVRLRNSHPAFNGTLEVRSSGPSRLRMSWQAVSSRCALEVDLSSGRVTIDEGLPGAAVEAPVG
jgi:sucrose phosphorylase